jgi:hypothetical protein
VKAARRFAVFPGAAEYHETREAPSDRRRVPRSEASGVALNSLCGARVGPAARAGGPRAGGGPAPRLYDEPPAGLGLCRACARRVLKRKGWARLLSHLFQNKRGFRSGVRSLGRIV